MTFLSCAAGRKGVERLPRVSHALVARLRVRGRRALGAAYVTHLLVGLAMAALGFWAGKRLQAPSVDRL